MSFAGFPRIGEKREVKKALERCDFSTKARLRLTLLFQCFNLSSLISIKSFLDVLASLWKLHTIGFPSAMAYIVAQCCSYWKKQIPLEELLAVDNEAQRLAWTLQADAGEFPPRCVHA